MSGTASVLYATIGRNSDGVPIVVPVKGTANSDGTASINAAGGGAANPTIDWVPTQGITHLTANTAKDVVLASATGRYLRFVNVSNTDIRVRLGGDATSTDEAVPPGMAFEVQGKTISKLSCICAATGEAFVIYVGTEV